MDPSLYQYHRDCNCYICLVDAFKAGQDIQVRLGNGKYMYHEYKAHYGIIESIETDSITSTLVIITENMKINITFGIDDHYDSWLAEYSGNVIEVGDGHQRLESKSGIMVRCQLDGMHFHLS